MSIIKNIYWFFYSLFIQEWELQKALKSTKAMCLIIIKTVTMEKKLTAPTKKGLVIFMQMRDSPMISDWQKK